MRSAGRVRTTTSTALVSKPEVTESFVRPGQLWLGRRPSAVWRAPVAAADRRPEGDGRQHERVTGW